MNTQQNPNPLDEAFDFLRRLPIPDPPANANAQVLARLAAGPLPSAPSVSLSRRRILMRVTKWSLAASVLAAVAGILYFGYTPASALADVIKAAEKHKLVKYKMTQTDETKDGSSVIPLVQEVYADLKAPRFRQGSKSIASLSGAIDAESIFVIDGSKNVTMHTITEVITEKGKTDPKLIKILKDFEKLGVPRTEATLQPASGDFTPATAQKSKSILENLRELEKHKDVVAAKSKFNGKDVLKYRIEEEHQTTVLWVDAGTKLPVKLEHELTDPKILHPTVTKMKYELTDFEWDPDLKGKTVDELFSTTPPKGYTVKDLRKKEEKKD
jgi:outer membrane lipoprotein-sorting protein